MEGTKSKANEFYKEMLQFLGLASAVQSLKKAAIMFTIFVLTDCIILSLENF